MTDNSFPVDDTNALPYYRERTEPIKYIIIHCSRGDAAQQLSILEQYKLSVHYIIDIKGKVTAVVPPELVAYHAGLSRWKDSVGESLNGASIGIEVQSLDMGQRKESFTAASTSKLCKLLRYLVYKYKVRRENILGHSDIAPTRKPDPGAGFPWHKLYKNDVLFWWHGSILSQERDEIKLLEIIGYDTRVLEAARYAFCRRFMPEEVAVIDDIQTLVDNPYPLDFKPQRWNVYIKRLRAVAQAFEKERQREYWYL